METDGTVLRANELFLRLMGYTLEKIRSRNDSLFVEESERTSSEYRELWAQLRQGL